FFLGSDTKVASQLQLWLSQYMQLAELIVGTDTYRISTLAAPLMVAEDNQLTSLLQATATQYNDLLLVTDRLCFAQAHNFLTLDFSHAEYPAIPVDEDNHFSLRFRFHRRL